jgi:hypothetical protein
VSALRAYLPLLLILVLAAAVRIPLVTLEFGRNGDGTGSFYGIIARNYLLRDNWPTLWMPVLSIGDAGHAPTLYAHHPPTVPLLTALSIAVFGDSDFAVRFPAFAFTLASVAALYIVVLRLGGSVPATVGALVLAFVPMSLRYGQMPDVVNSQLVFTGLLTLAMYLRFLDRNSVPRLMMLLGSFTAAALTDWPAFFLAPVLGAHLLIARPEGWLRCGVCLLVVSVGLFGGLYLWISAATGDWGLIVRQFLNRAAQSRTDDHRAYTLATWVAGVWTYQRELHTIPLVAVGAVGWAVAAIRCRKSRLSLLVVLALGWAALHAIVGRQGVLNHDWWWWPMTLALAVSAAGLAEFVVKWPPVEGRSAWACGAVIAMAGVGCIVWTITETRHVLSPAWVHGAIPQYTPKELGEVIRKFVPPERAVMLFESDAQPYMHYNADRPILFSVWDPETFERRMVSGEADLFYSFSQRIDAPPAALIFPKQYTDKGLPLLDYLRSRFAEEDTGRFLVFDLQRPRRSTGRLN